MIMLFIIMMVMMIAILIRINMIHHDFLIFKVDFLSSFNFVPGIYEIFSKKKCQVGLQSEKYPGTESVSITFISSQQ